MSISSQAELDALRAIGGIVRKALDTMAAAVRPGVTTAELDGIGRRVLVAHGAESAPPKVYGFPGSVCISVNDEAIHGIPSDRALRAGDLVKLDLVAEKQGFMADAAVTLGVGKVSDTAYALMRCAERALRQAAKVARVGYRLDHIGGAVEREVTRRGFRVMRAFGGHGVGRAIHEAPAVPNYADPSCRQPLTEGLVITVEPIISAGAPWGTLQPDGWTVRTVDGSLAAHYEHTLVITHREPILLTA